MFIKKDSLLLRIISYNGIAIVIVASIMATLLELWFLMNWIWDF